eukprot:TRINITY_DN11680_c0_g1_i1.p1 TRINITY_DN11680_c0_g1~~TRINITY_DN11680_c0_g1_i1.p1  ORF type:complete len:2660 (-),score=545.44 TRINITY_DN11680_c0_g1_i1:944-8551(-)
MARARQVEQLVASNKAPGMFASQQLTERMAMHSEFAETPGSDRDYAHSISSQVRSDDEDLSDLVPGSILMTKGWDGVKQVDVTPQSDFDIGGESQINDRGQLDRRNLAASGPVSEEVDLSQAISISGVLEASSEDAAYKGGPSLSDNGRGFASPEYGQGSMEEGRQLEIDQQEMPMQAADRAQEFGSAVDRLDDEDDNVASPDGSSELGEAEAEHLGTATNDVERAKVFVQGGKFSGEQEGVNDILAPASLPRADNEILPERRQVQHQKQHSQSDQEYPIHEEEQHQFSAVGGREGESSDDEEQELSSSEQVGEANRNEAAPRTKEREPWGWQIFRIKHRPTVQQWSEKVLQMVEVMERLQRDGGSVVNALEKWNGTAAEFISLLKKMQASKECASLSPLVFNFMKSRPWFQPKINVYNRIIHYAAQRRDVAHAMALLTEVEEHPKLKADSLTYAGMIAALAIAGRYEEGVQLLRKRKEAGDRRLMDQFKVLLYCADRPAPLAWVKDLTEEAEALGLQCDPETYEILMERFAARNMFPFVEQIFFCMRQAGLVPSNRGNKLLIEALAFQGKGSEIESAVAAMEPGSLPHNYEVMRVLALARGGSVDAALKGFRALDLHKRRVAPHLYNSLILACARAGRMEDADELLASMKEHGHPRTALTYNVLLDASIKAESLASIDSIIARMAADSVLPDSFTYSLLIQSCKLHEDMGTRALSLFADMQACGLTVDIVIFVVLGDILYKAGMWVEAGQVYNTMRSMGVFPNRAAASCFGWAVLRGKDLEACIRIVQETLNLSADDKLLSGLFASAIQMNRTDELAPLLAAMEELKPRMHDRAVRRLEFLRREAAAAAWSGSGGKGSEGSQANSKIEGGQPMVDWPASEPSSPSPWLSAGDASNKLDALGSPKRPVNAHPVVPLPMTAFQWRKGIKHDTDFLDSPRRQTGGGYSQDSLRFMPGASAGEANGMSHFRMSGADGSREDTPWWLSDARDQEEDGEVSEGEGQDGMSLRKPKIASQLKQLRTVQGYASNASREARNHPGVRSHRPGTSPGLSASNLTGAADGTGDVLTDLGFAKVKGRAPVRAALYTATAAASAVAHTTNGVALQGSFEGNALELGGGDAGAKLRDREESVEGSPLAAVPLTGKFAGHSDRNTGAAPVGERSGRKKERHEETAKEPWVNGAMEDDIWGVMIEDSAHGKKGKKVRKGGANNRGARSVPLKKSPVQVDRRSGQQVEQPPAAAASITQTPATSTGIVSAEAARRELDDPVETSEGAEEEWDGVEWVIKRLSLKGPRVVLEGATTMAADDASVHCMEVNGMEELGHVTEERGRHEAREGGEMSLTDVDNCFGSFSLSSHPPNVVGEEMTSSEQPLPASARSHEGHRSESSTDGKIGGTTEGHGVDLRDGAAVSDGGTSDGPPRRTARSGQRVNVIRYGTLLKRKREPLTGAVPIQGDLRGPGGEGRTRDAAQLAAITTDTTPEISRQTSESLARVEQQVGSDRLFVPTKSASDMITSISREQVEVAARHIHGLEQNVSDRIADAESATAHAASRADGETAEAVSRDVKVEVAEAAGRAAEQEAAITASRAAERETAEDITRVAEREADEATSRAAELATSSEDLSSSEQSVAAMHEQAHELADERRPSGEVSTTGIEGVSGSFEEAFESQLMDSLPSLAGTTVLQEQDEGTELAEGGKVQETENASGVDSDMGSASLNGALAAEQAPSVQAANSSATEEMQEDNQETEEEEDVEYSDCLAEELPPVAVVADCPDSSPSAGIGARSAPGKDSRSSTDEDGVREEHDMTEKPLSAAGNGQKVPRNGAAFSLGATLGRTAAKAGLGEQHLHDMPKYEAVISVDPVWEEQEEAEQEDKQASYQIAMTQDTVAKEDESSASFEGSDGLGDRTQQAAHTYDSALSSANERREQSFDRKEDLKSLLGLSAISEGLDEDWLSAEEDESATWLPDEKSDSGFMNNGLDISKERAARSSVTAGGHSATGRPRGKQEGAGAELDERRGPEGRSLFARSAASRVWLSPASSAPSPVAAGGRALQECHDVWAALKLSLRRGMQPDADRWLWVMAMYRDLGEAQSVLEVLSVMERASQTPPPIAAYNIALSVSKRDVGTTDDSSALGQGELTLELLQAFLSRGVAPNKDTLRLLIHRTGSAGAPPVLVSPATLLDCLLESGCLPRPQLLEWTAQLCCESPVSLENLRFGVRLVKLLRKEGQEPSAATCRALMEAHGEIRALRAARALMREIGRAGWLNARAAYQALIEAHLRAGKQAEATKLLLLDMRATGVQPGQAELSLLVRAAAEAGEGVEELLEEVEGEGCGLEPAAFEAALASLLQQRQVLKASRWMRHMLSMPASEPPSDGLVAALLEGLRERRLFRPALDIFQLLQPFPEARTLSAFTTVLETLMECQQAPLAATLLQEMSQCRLVPSASLVARLTQALEQMGAEEQLAFVRQAAPYPPAPEPRSTTPPATLNSADRLQSLRSSSPSSLLSPSASREPSGRPWTRTSADSLRSSRSGSASLSSSTVQR